MDSLNSKEPEELFYLANENGEQMAFHFLDCIMVEDREFLVLMPAEGPYVNEAVILERLKEKNGEESYIPVEEMKTIRAVYDLFRQRAGDAFIYTDEN